MSDPHGTAAEPMVRQGELISEIARTVVEVVDEPWTTVQYVARSLAPYMTHGTYVTRPDGSVERQFPPEEAVDLADELRQVMYQPGAGTWFTAVVTVDDQGRVSAEFNYDDEPDWPRPVEPVWYVQDLAKFPRDADAIPDWLRNRLVEGEAQQRHLDAEDNA